MEDTWSEYVDLISTASLDLHPENHGSSFTNELVIPQQLPENTYVSLEEISYVSAFYNIQHSRNNITIYDMLYEYPPNTERNPNRYPIYGAYRNCPLKEGYYDSMEKLCEALNEAIKQSGVQQVKNRDIFKFNPTTMKFSFDVEGLWLTMWLRGDILHYLGVITTRATDYEYVTIGKPRTGPTYVFPTASGPITRRFEGNPKWTWSVSEQETKDEFDYVAQLRIIDSFVVYIDCVTSQVTGDTFSNALRILPIKEEKAGTNITHSFEKVYPLKVNKRYIPSIKVEIRDLYNELIDFKVGFVRLKLRFTQQS